MTSKRKSKLPVIFKLLTINYQGVKQIIQNIRSRTPRTGGIGHLEQPAAAGIYQPGGTFAQGTGPAGRRSCTSILRRGTAGSGGTGSRPRRRYHGQPNVIGESFRHGVKKLLFLGSTCIYPREAPQPMKEEVLLTSPLEYTNEPYAIAKIAGLKMCESFNLQYGTNYIAVMPTNLYGPNDNFHLENSHVLPAMIRKIHLAKCLNEGDWEAVRKDIDLRPVEGVNGSNSQEEILEKLAKFGITPHAVTLWGTGKPLREFLWSEEMADASVHVLLNVDFKDTYREGDKEIRNCHINVGTGKELSIPKPDGTLRKLTDVSKLHSLGWHHQVEIDEGIHRLYAWYLKGICINHQTV